MNVCVEVIVARKLLLIKFSNQVFTGLPYFLMYTEWLEVSKNVNYLQKKKRLAPLPLLPVFVEEPFRKWGLDFIGEINPPSSGQFKWILTAIDYFTKWVEAIPTRK